jgi:anti-sigma B factor antagonist
VNLPNWLRRRARAAGEEPTPQAAPEPGAAGLGVAVQVLEARTRVIVVGELDLSNAAQLAARLAEAEATGPAELEIDLRRLAFMDSSGLAQLFAAHRRAHESGRRLVIVKDHGPIERILNLARVEDVIEVVEQPAA